MFNAFKFNVQRSALRAQSSSIVINLDDKYAR